LQYLPNATATVIDSWKNYNEIYSGSSIDYLKNIEENNAESIFKNNIQIAGMVDRITSIKGDSSKILIKLLTENNKFDFIYVDGSHKCLDCYSDCLLSWSLLKSAGIMAIDDYLYKTTNNVLDHVSAGVDHFLLKIEGEYKMLNNGYRIFIQKI
jgi:predicted O-methyltransferase YrrM